MTSPNTTVDLPPRAKPHGTTADQVAAMEAEGQGQTSGGDAAAAPSESAAEDQAIDTVATGLVSSDDDEAGRP